MKKKVSRALSLALLSAFVTHAAAGSDDDTVAQLIRDLGLIESSKPVREMPGWKRPERVVVRVNSPERLEWLKVVADGVELIGVRTEKEARAAVGDAQALLGFCESSLIASGPKLHWVQVYSAGVDYCGLEQMRQRGGLMSNLQRLASAGIADHAMAMLLTMSRSLRAYVLAQSNGDWRPLPFTSPKAWELDGQTMLVVGLGGIGTQVARRANAFGMRVLATRNSSREGPEFVDYVGLADELLELAAQADVVVNSAPLTPATEGLFDAEFFAAMKPTAYFINVGRGRSAVTQDLVAALQAGELAGAGLDVVDPEPLPADHPLWQMPSVIITPHVAGRSNQALERVFVIIRENLRRYIHGERMLSLVDLDAGY